MNKETLTLPDDQPADSAWPAEGMPLRKKLRLPRWIWAITSGCPLLLCVFLWGGYADGDHAVRHILIFVTVALVLASLLGWFVFYSRYRLWVCLLAAGVGLLGFVVLFSIFSFKGVTGELWPILSFRWQSTPLTLEHPDPQSVDLSKTTPHDFAQFLGPLRNAAVENLTLDSDWQQRPPKKLWSRGIGEGWSGFAAVNGYAVTMEQRDAEEWVTCYEIETGRLCWKHVVSARHTTFLGGVGPRSTPTIHEGNVYALGATGILRCLDGENGRLLWQQDLLQLAGSDPKSDLKAITWGRSSSPLLVDDKVIIPLGGPPSGIKSSLIALHKWTGKPLWRGGDRQASYSSPTLMTLAQHRQIVIVNEDNVSGHDVQTGQLLWQYDWAGQSNGAANVSQAVALPGDQVLVSKGYQQGAMVLHIEPAKNDSAPQPYVATFRWGNPSVLKTKFTNVVQFDGFIYGLSDGILECVDAQDGSRQWKKGRYGHGQVLRVGSQLLVLSEKGDLHLISLTPQEMRSQAVCQVLERKCWTNLCLYGDQLLVRGVDEIACYRLPVQPEPPTPTPGS